MQKQIRLAVIDDQQLFRAGLVSLIKEYNDIEVVIEASDGKDLILQMENQVPDVILLDVEMPNMDGFETVKYLRKHHKDIKILILTMYDEEHIILNLIGNGAHGFLLKNQDIDIIISAIHSVIEEGYYFNNSVSKSLVKELMSSKMSRSNFKKADLSRREIEVVRMICKEYTNKEIADKLFISERTVDGHRGKILTKTKAKNAVGIAMYAFKNHLLGLPKLKK